jgi:hypothetical protein
MLATSPPQPRNDVRLDHESETVVGGAIRESVHEVRVTVRPIPATSTTTAQGTVDVWLPSLTSERSTRGLDLSIHVVEVGPGGEVEVADSDEHRALFDAALTNCGAAAECPLTYRITFRAAETMPETTLAWAFSYWLRSEPARFNSPGDAFTLTGPGRPLPGWLAPLLGLLVGAIAALVVEARMPRRRDWERDPAVRGLTVRRMPPIVVLGSHLLLAALIGACTFAVVSGPFGGTGGFAAIPLSMLLITMLVVGVTLWRAGGGLVLFVADALAATFFLPVIVWLSGAAPSTAASGGAVLIAVVITLLTVGVVGSQQAPGRWSAVPMRRWLAVSVHAILIVLAVLATFAMFGSLSGGELGLALSLVPIALAAGLARWWGGSRWLLVIVDILLVLLGGAGVIWGGEPLFGDPFAEPDETLRLVLIAFFVTTIAGLVTASWQPEPDPDAPAPDPVATPPEPGAAVRVPPEAS